MNSILINDLKEIVTRIPYQMCEGMTFLITGANGSLARYMVMTLMYLNNNMLKSKCNVIALCRNESKARLAFKEYMDDENFHLCVQSVEEKLPDFGSIDYIIHAASSAATNMFEKYAVDILSANVAGTINLLNLSCKKKVKKFLFFSSGAVYGDIPDDYGQIREGDYFSLEFTNIKNCYAEGKRTGEVLCKAYWKQYNIPTVSVRISHTYGPGIDLNDGHVYSDFVKNILNNKDLVIMGDGMSVRPFCYITDAVVAFFLLLFRGENGEAYNMANCEETYTIKELADELVSNAFPEKNLSVTGLHIIKDIKIEKMKINIDKIENLGWTPFVNVIEGFRRTVKSFEIG